LAKALLGTYHYEYQHEDKSFEGHSLKALWDELGPQLEPLDPSYYSDDAHAFRSEAVEYIGECVKVIHGADPDGQSIRYGENRKGQLNMKSIVTVNLDVLLDMCKMTMTWMLSALHHRNGVDNFLRHERGYFKLPE